MITNGGYIRRKMLLLAKHSVYGAYGKTTVQADRWRNDLQAPITTRRRRSWRKWLACGCLVLLVTAGMLTTLWYYW